MYADYFTKVLEDDLKAVVKPQYVDQIPRAVKGPVQNVGDLIKARAQLGNLEHILDTLGMAQLQIERCDNSANDICRVETGPGP